MRRRQGLISMRQHEFVQRTIWSGSKIDGLSSVAATSSKRSVLRLLELYSILVSQKVHPQFDICSGFCPTASALLQLLFLAVAVTQFSVLS